MFIALRIGSRSLSSHIQELRGGQSLNPELPELIHVVSLGEGEIGSAGVRMQSYSDFAPSGSSVSENDPRLKAAEDFVGPDDVANLQFTSGIPPLEAQSPAYL